MTSVDMHVLDAFRESLGGDPDLIRRVVDAFLNELTADVDRMRPALDNEDWHTLRRCAHNLKSSSAVMGAAALSAECAALEIAAKSRDAEACQKLVGRVEQERPGVQAALTTVQ